MRAPTSRPGWIGAAALALALLWSAPVAAENGVTPTEIVLGQSSALSGPLAELGLDLAIGAKAYFDRVNAEGGVHGRQIRVISLDDGYDPERARDNGERLIKTDKVFALFNLFGTGANIKLMPLIESSGIPNFAPYTGSDAVRIPFRRPVFNIRAGYADETEKIVEHLRVRGITRVGVLYQNNAFGKGGLASTERALARHQLQPSATASIQDDASDVDQAARAIGEKNVQAIIMITAGKATPAFIHRFNQSQRGMLFFTLSVMGTQTSVADLDKDGVGVVVSQVVPFPFSATSPIVAEYQKTLAKAGIKTRSFASMEGFISAKTIVEILRRSGPDPTRERFIASAESLQKYDLGGITIDFSKNNHDGSGLVELTAISRDGRFIR